MLRPKKHSYKQFDDKKKIPAARKFPIPPITCLMVRPLVEVQTNAGYIDATHA